MNTRSRARRLAGLGVLLAWGTGCDNVGRVWDPNYGGRPETEAESAIAAPHENDVSLGGQPSATVVAPLGGNWLATTPAVVIFSEAVNRQSVYDEALEIERIFLREKIAQAKVRSSVGFLGNGRAVILRPATPLVTQATYEIVMERGVRDLDGNLARGAGILGEFSVTVSPEVRPRVVAAFPVAGQLNSIREAPAVVVFDGPAAASSVTPASFFLRREDTQAAVPGSISFPLQGFGGAETRVAAFVPNDPLEPSSRHGIVLTEQIEVAGRALDPGARTPFSTFTTLGWRKPVSVAIGNPVAGFPDAINLTNLERLLLDVALTVDAQPGDRVEVRVYGRDPRTRTRGQQRFIQLDLSATGGAVTETLDFSGALGLTTIPVFLDGSITLAVRLVRGSIPGAWHVRSGVVQDLVRPALLRLGPPAGADPLTEFVTDLQACSLFGQASEKLGQVELNASGQNDLFASDAEGRFFLKPWNLGRLTAPEPFTLQLTDTAGNLNEAAYHGTVTQRGLLTGDVTSTGSLTVEAWDLETFKPLVGARVLLEPGAPVSPPVGRVIGTTGATGQVLFTGLGEERYTITVVASGYTLASVVNTKAAFVSLPLEPLAGDGATLGGTVAFTQAAGRTAFVGCNVLADQGAGNAVGTSLGAPTTIPNSPILPGRPVMLSALVGIFPPTARPTLSAFGTPQALQAGAGVTLVPPASGLEPGATLTVALTTATPLLVGYGGSYALDLTGRGLDSSAFAPGYPRVLVTASLEGLTGGIPFGVGFTTGSPNNLSVDGQYSGLLGSFAGLNPLLWSALEARDSAGNIGRHRELFADYNLGTLVGLPLAFPAIPVLSLPASSNGPPEIEWTDGLAQAGLFTTLHRVIARDGNGRRWLLWVPDRDGVGTDTLQLPDLAASVVTGLAIPSTWTVFVESWLSLIVGAGSEDLVLEELFRRHATFARGAASTCAVQ